MVEVPRAFVLLRHHDPSQVSGTGVVAEGTQWTDGSASVRWRGADPTVAYWPGGIAAIERIHGHGGATEVLFLDEAPAGFNALRKAVLADKAAVVVPNVDHLKPYGDVSALVEELKAPSGHHVLPSEPEGD